MSTSRTLLLATALAGVLIVPSVTNAQPRGRAVPRGSVRPAPGRPPAVAVRPPIRPYAYRPYVYRPYYYTPYRPGVSLGFYFGYPGYAGPYAYGYGAPYGYPYRYGYPPYGYGYPAYAARPYGGVRIDLPQREAEVYVDSYYVGIVDDFDGALQQVNLEPGPHRVEVRLDGFEPVAFDVNVEPGRTITYRSALRQAEP